VRKALPSTPIEFTFEATPTPTSKFEVTVNGVLLHTKVGDGGLSPSGFPDTPAKLTPIIDAISAAASA